MNNAEELENKYDYRTQLIKDSIRQLKKFGKVHLFSMEQIEEIQKVMPNITYKKLESRLYLVRRKNED